MNDGLTNHKITFDEDSFEMEAGDAPNSIQFQLQGSIEDESSHLHKYTLYSSLHLSRLEYGHFNNQLHS